MTSPTPQETGLALAGYNNADRHLADFPLPEAGFISFIFQ